MLVADPQRRGDAAIMETLMRIAQVAPPFESVPPTRYGGTERVVSMLTEELVRRGHDVTLFASGDSQTSARLVATHPVGLRLDPQLRDYVAATVVHVGEAYRQASDFDLIHKHCDYLAFPFARLTSTPTLTTAHGRLDLPEIQRLYGTYPEQALVALSADQRGYLPAATWVATAPNA